MAQFFWTKVWGRPGEPANSALLFNSENVRDEALQTLSQGDVVVYLTSDATEADPLMKGRVCGAVEIDGDKVLAADLGIEDRARPVDFRKDGRFRWPYGISIQRAWRVVDTKSNDNLIPKHADKGIQGAATIHEMHPSEIQRFLSLRVHENFDDDNTETRPVPFATSLKRPWRQKEGERSATNVSPGTDLYVAVVSDSFGTTFKVGSGKADDRLAQMNLFRRGSLREPLWSIILQCEFETVEKARSAEDQMITAIHTKNFSLPDHTEFAHGISFEEMKVLFNEAVSAAME